MLAGHIRTGVVFMEMLWPGPAPAPWSTGVLIADTGGPHTRASNEGFRRSREDFTIMEKASSLMTFALVSQFHIYFHHEKALVGSYKSSRNLRAASTSHTLASCWAALSANSMSIIKHCAHLSSGLSYLGGIKNENKAVRPGAVRGRGRCVASVSPHPRCRCGTDRPSL